MKILYWTPLFWPEIGGIEVTAMKMLPALQKQGYQFVVLASHGRSAQPDVTDFSGIPVYRFPIWTAVAKNNLGQIVKIRKQISHIKKTFEPDLIHINFSGYMAYFQLVTAPVCPAPTVIRLSGSLHGTNVGGHSVLGRLIQAADWIAAVSEAMLAEARQALPEIAQRSSVIPGCQEVPTVVPSRLPFDAPRIVCLGRLAHEKGFDLVLTALAALAGRFPRLTLTVAGDGPARAELEKQAADLGLAGIVTFMGRIDNREVPALMNTATVVVIPSRCRDAFPIVALEAAQMARPIIAANLGGLPETVLHGETGLLVEAEDAAGFAESIAFLLQSRKAAERMGQAGRMRALRLFGIEHSVAAYHSLYHRLLHGGHCGAEQCGVQPS